MIFSNIRVKIFDHFHLEKVDRKKVCVSSPPLTTSFFAKLIMPNETKKCKWKASCQGLSEELPHFFRRKVCQCCQCTEPTCPNHSGGKQCFDQIKDRYRRCVGCREHRQEMKVQRLSTKRRGRVQRKTPPKTARVVENPPSSDNDVPTVPVVEAPFEIFAFSDEGVDSGDEDIDLLADMSIFSPTYSKTSLTQPSPSDDVGLLEVNTDEINRGKTLELSKSEEKDLTDMSQETFEEEVKKVAPKQLFVMCQHKGFLDLKAAIGGDQFLENIIVHLWIEKGIADIIQTVKLQLAECFSVV